MSYDENRINDLIDGGLHQKKMEQMSEAAEHRERLKILEKHLLADFYHLGQYHNKISDAIKDFHESQMAKMPSCENLIALVYGSHEISAYQHALAQDELKKLLNKP